MKTYLALSQLLCQPLIDPHKLLFNKMDFPFIYLLFWTFHESVTHQTYWKAILTFTETLLQLKRNFCYLNLHESTAIL